MNRLLHRYLYLAGMALGTVLVAGLPVRMATAQSNLSDYDQSLCATAQRLLVNAGPGDFVIETLRGSSNGFHTIQMDVDTVRRTVTVAAATEVVNVDGQELATSVACKMVDRQRINDVLALELAGPDQRCADVNRHTYQIALASLAEEERSRYLTAGRKLEFAQDHMSVSGGEWLPARADDYITLQTGGSADAPYLQVIAPSVRVPWNPEQHEFYQGTQHCKLITLAAMLRWMQSAAFSSTKELFPRVAELCVAPHSMTSQSGSCLFWFAPAQAMFCQDYSGAAWDTATAQEECSKRHASAAALQRAGSKYTGKGGRYSADSCVNRKDSAPLASTCVFHCKAADETLWHTLEGVDTSSPAANSMMNKACDLFIESR
jgi:hypothetical protein